MNTSQKIGCLLGKGEQLQRLYCTYTKRNQVSGGSLLGVRYLDLCSRRPKVGLSIFGRQVSALCTYFLHKVRRDKSEECRKAAALSSAIRRDLEDLQKIASQSASSAEAADVYVSYYSIFHNDSVPTTTNRSM